MNFLMTLQTQIAITVVIWSERSMSLIKFPELSYSASFKIVYSVSVSISDSTVISVHFQLAHAMYI